MWYMNEDRKLLQKSFKEYVQKRVRPFAKELEDAEASPRELLQEMGRLGMFTMPIPEEYTGTGPDYISWGLLLEEISKESSTFGFLTLLRQVFNGPLLKSCS